MTAGEIFLGTTAYRPSEADVEGEYITLEGEPWFKIDNYDRMKPFFMSIVSDSNFWLFASTNGGLACGRVQAELSIFPYYTVDKIHDEHPTTGPKTAMLVEKNGKTHLWEPFVFHPAVYKTTRNLYKNMLGNQVIYEEVNEDLGVTFTYRWASADEYGIVRKCEVVNNTGDEVKIRVLDGMQNLMPANTVPFLQDCMSNLLDAYKWNELLEQQVGSFCLFAKLSDRAEALESLNATTVWHTGLPQAQVLLSDTQVAGFCRGQPVIEEDLIRGRRGAYLVHSSFTLSGKQSQKWMFVAEVEQTHEDISKLQTLLAKEGAGVMKLVEENIESGCLGLKRIMGAADGFQCSEDTATSTHHYANVMFNAMRGGIYNNGYEIDRADFIAFIKKRNTKIAKEHESFLSSFPEVANYLDVVAKAEEKGDVNLTRLVREYVPVTWSRRHGDPSRPWNKFNIVLKTKEGEKILNYQGNWRDIFQNWEAMTISFPYYFESIVCKFLNASTIDGYNPYVVNKAEGCAWECPEPEHPHANIGYWGDHQIIYLLKLLEWWTNFEPAKLAASLQKDSFSYANVPYEIRPYPKIVEDAKDTITFNWEKHDRITETAKTMGFDSKLVLDKTGSVYHVNLGEKLLIPLLAKASNFVVEGGIWLNTQRPEWNDANNAIVGFGLSMVTVYYMRRYVGFMLRLLQSVVLTELHLSTEVAGWLTGLAGVYDASASLVGGGKAMSDVDRRKILDALGEVASTYRWSVYKTGFSGAKTDVSIAKIISFLECLQKYIDHSIAINLRDDGLYHAYNLLKLTKDGAEVSYLYEMLEGQVSVLSSGSVVADDAAKLFQSMYKSKIFRPDQHTFMLYPDRNLLGFMARNKVPTDKADLPCVKYCLDNKLRTILYQDVKGDIRFAAPLGNAKDLKAAIEAKGTTGLADHTEGLLDLYELVFNHRAFTGRSGTMFGFEGVSFPIYRVHIGFDSSS